MAVAALFPDLLGREFDGLDARVRAVHGGAPRVLRGSATIERGTSVLARFFCAIAFLPRNQCCKSAVVEIVTMPDGEQWTRHFGESAPMRSRLRARGDLLVERLGPVTMAFELVARDGGIDWVLRRVAALGCPLPLRWFRVASRSGVRAGRYQFLVLAELSGVGRIIRYEGELDSEAV
jgi:hypothetical protein